MQGAPDRQWDRRMRITDRKFEVNELVGMILGIGPQRIYEALTFVFLFSFLYGCRKHCHAAVQRALLITVTEFTHALARRWGLAAIFGTTVASVVPVVGLSTNTWPW